MRCVRCDVRSECVVCCVCHVPSEPRANPHSPVLLQAAPADRMIPPEVLSGNVTFETCFFDGDEFLVKNVVRLYYT